MKKAHARSVHPGITNSYDTMIAWHTKAWQVLQILYIHSY